MTVRAMAAGTTESLGATIRLKRDAIRRVDIVELPYKYRGDYSERPTRYMVTLNNETRPRRVYATPIGNVAVFYLKSHGHEIYCEAALDAALYREGRSGRLMPDNAIIERVYNAYLECALWSSHDEDTGECLDTLGYSVSDMDEDTLSAMYSDCGRFYSDNQELINNLCDAGLTDCDKIGHDLWLTRNRHGAGFWDRGLGDAGDTLTQAAHVMGELSLYVGDDNRVYGFAG